MRTRVKICGITRPQDGLAAARAGADAIGLVFFSRSPRCVDITRALTICRTLPPFVTVVGLFVNAARERVKEVLAAVPLDLLQFHGGESSDQCEGFGRPYIKAIGMKQGLDPLKVMREHPLASGFLLDAWQPELYGGGGVGFDWSQVPGQAERPLILAGGLDADNVSRAIVETRPWGVDVSSGVETDKGIKSEDRIIAFMRGVERGDTSRTGR
ncbi:MAG TPA: phosphoribosylanthranilate isomerase [Gammaproteobacteria bacterium]|nr:phosphoribosylanthranilate isomerase [Gammaproteobacteria bacterium]